MGVTGLWRLIEPAGKPVPVETLENKILAVDISIWLHQMVKGYQDAKGAPLPNAHLMGLFQRLCKLLYFRIKPIFVFDGAFPDLKKETIAKRQNHKAKYQSESERLKRELAILLTKKSVVGGLLGKQISPHKSKSTSNNEDDLFKLPALPENEQESDSESEDEQNSSGSIVDLHSVDVESENFKTLPVKEKYDLLIELKETRKMNSWGRLHELPKESNNFSDFQMQRLLKRKKVQECLEETEKEMGDCGMSLNDLENLLNEEGIDTKFGSFPTRRIASNNTTRFLLINNVKQALADAKKKNEINNPGTSKVKDNPEDKVADETKQSKKDELEDDLEKAIKMSMECVDDVETSACGSKTDESWTSFVTDSEHTDSEEEDGFEQPEMSSAKAYIMQYSDFTHKVIDKLIAPKNSDKNKSKIPKVDQILEELSKEKSVIVDNVDLSSSDDEYIEKPTLSNKHKNEHQDSSVVELNTTNDDLESLIDTDTTLASVVCVENPRQDIISVDTSTVEESQEKEEIAPKNSDKNKCKIPKVDQILEGLSKEKSGIIYDADLSSSEYECIEKPTLSNKHKNEHQDNSVVELNTTNDDLESTMDIDTTLASVVCVENPRQDIISVDTSTEEESKEKEEIAQIKLNVQEPESVSESSDDDFEEVPVEDNTFLKPVVQLTLKVDEAPIDDIFADIFETKHDNSTIVKNYKSETEMVAKEFEHNSDEIITCDDIRADITSQKENTSKDDAITQNALCESLPNKEEIMETENAKVEKKDTNKNMSPEPEACKESKFDQDKNATVIQPTREPISKEELNNIAEKLDDQEHNLLQEKGRLDRIGRNITEQMTKEAQELLQLFGIPYIVAPMEAEAQCAFLETINLTDGTITDDSDIWLFGGRTVYKNFFNQKKHVLQFLAERIERSFNLTREQLVLLALLVGSDYTTGLTGVGPVTALEILASFPFNKKQVQSETTKQAQAAKMVAGLQEFKQWVRAGKRTDNTTLKKKLRNVSVTDDFPSVRVVQAYLEPNVEKSDDQFTWGEIDITLLRDYTKAKFGWSQNKLDEIVKPVLKRMLERKSQKSVHDYFKKKIDVSSLDNQISKRVKAAIQKMGPEASHEELDVLNVMGINVLNEPSAAVKKRKYNKKANVQELLNNEPGPSKPKQKKSNADSLPITALGIKVVSQTEDDNTGKSTIQINIPKTDRFQEIIPQREKDKHSILQNKMKAIEIFRKTKMDRKKKTTKRKVNLPKEKAELSESDSD